LCDKLGKNFSFCFFFSVKIQSIAGDDLIEFQRENPKRRRETVYVGCGAGFGGDRPLAALKLLQRVEELNYLVLECLAERTLADRWLSMASGGLGYDPRVSEWMQLLLPLAVERGTCIITNMGASKCLQYIMEEAFFLSVFLFI
jgi:hypothetical protein